MNRRVAATAAVVTAGWLTFAGGIPRTPASVAVALVTAMLVGGLVGAGVSAYRSREAS